MALSSPSGRTPAVGIPLVRVLGPVRFVSDTGTDIDLPSPSQRAVLARLAVEPQATIRFELLCDDLATSPGSLRTTVCRLRGCIGHEPIATEPTGYRLTCGTDAAAFATEVHAAHGAPDAASRFEDALARWHGPALDEFSSTPWAQAEAHRLEELRCVAIDGHAEALLTHGLVGEAVASLEAQVTTHPLRDGAWGLLIRALASAGRQADALRAYHLYRTLLAEETGTAPSPTVADIERRVAAGWDGLEP